MANTKLLENRNPIKKRTKSFLQVAIFAFLTITPLIYFSSYSQTRPHSSLPYINIQCDEEITKDEYTDCTFSMDNLTIRSKIKLRGNSNAELDKPGYRLEFSRRISLLGMRKDDDWQLFAMHRDRTKMRVKLSFDFWNIIQDEDSNSVLPKSKYVNLYLNNEYMGLFLLAEKNDRRLYGFDKAQNNVDSSLIFHCSSRNLFQRFDIDNWDQNWPNEDEGIYIKDEILPEIADFIAFSTNNEFFNSTNGIYSIFDKNNLIDFYLYNFFIFHDDFWDRNYFIIRPTAPNTFYFLPWDFDYTFGKTFRYSDDAKEFESYIKQKNLLYSRLLRNDEFEEDCEARWSELRENFMTDDFIFDIISDIYEEIENSLKKDSEKWYPEINPENKVKELKEWISGRLEFCDDYFDI